MLPMEANDNGAAELTKQSEGSVLDPQERLDDLLRAIAQEKLLDDGKDQSEIIDRVKDELVDIYLKGEHEGRPFRHSYASITRALIDASKSMPVSSSPGRMAKDDNESHMPSMLNETAEYIVTCLSNVRERAEQDGPEALLKPLDKLIDHIKLETVRITLLTDNMNDAEEKIESSNEQLRLTEKKISKLERKIKTENARLDNVQREYIGILGVFSAVALIANGAIGFGDAVLSTTKNYDAIQDAFLITVVGFFMFNIFYALMSFVYNIINSRREDESNRPERHRERFAAWINSPGVMSHLAFVIIDAAIAVLIALLLALMLGAPQCGAQPLTQPEGSGYEQAGNRTEDVVYQNGSESGQ